MKSIVESLNFSERDREVALSKFYNTLRVLTKDGGQMLQNSIKILNEFGVFIKPSQLKLGLLDSKVLFDRLTFAANNGLLEAIKTDPLLLFDKSLFRTTTKDIQKEIVEQVHSDNYLEALESEENILLNEETYETYEEILYYLKPVIEILGSKLIIDSNKANDNVVKLTARSFNNIQDILINSLIHAGYYNEEEINIIKEAVGEILTRARKTERVV